jgi:hypothetical protein
MWLLKRLFGGGTPPPAATRPVPDNDEPGGIDLSGGLAEMRGLAQVGREPGEPMFLMMGL